VILTFRERCDDPFPLSSRLAAGLGRVRRPTKQMTPPPFKVTREKAVQELLWEVGRLGGKYPLLSANVEPRRDGLPRATTAEPPDPGVAIISR
jgi:hypothetical protein